MKIEMNKETNMPELFNTLYQSKGGILHRLVASGMIGRTHAINQHGIVKTISDELFCDHGTPWHMTNMDGDRKCTHYMDILFKVLQLLPKRCCHCWKVVAKPTTVAHLIAVKEIQKKMVSEDPGCWCKCGIEERDYVHGNYGAYWYNNSLEAGLDKLDWVRKLMAVVDPKMQVFLKRGCTEMEEKFGDSRKWDEVREKGKHQQVEDLANSFIEIRKGISTQPEICQELVQIRWLIFANDRGDETAKFLNGGDPYIKDYVKYERQEEVNVQEKTKPQESCTGDCKSCGSESASDCNAKLETKTVDSKDR